MTRADDRDMAMYWRRASALASLVDNGDRSIDEVGPWLQHAIEGKFNELPRGNPVQYNPFSSPDVQFRKLQELNEQRGWRFTKEELSAVAPNGEWAYKNTRGQRSAIVLMAYLDNPHQTAKEWWEIATTSPQYGAVIWDGKHISFYGDSFIRVRAGLDTPVHKLRWEVLDFNVNGIPEYDAKPYWYAQAQILAAAAYHPAWVANLDERNLRAVLLPGFQVREDIYSDWEQTLYLRWNPVHSRIELGAVKDRQQAHRFCLPSVEVAPIP